MVKGQNHKISCSTIQRSLEDRGEKQDKKLISSKSHYGLAVNLQVKKLLRFKIPALRLYLPNCLTKKVRDKVENWLSQNHYIVKKMKKIKIKMNA